MNASAESYVCEIVCESLSWRAVLCKCWYWESGLNGCRCIVSWGLHAT